MTTFRDALDMAQENDIEGFKNTIDSILMAKIGNAIDAYRPEYAATMFADQEDFEDSEEPVEVVDQTQEQEIENEDI